MNFDAAISSPDETSATINGVEVNDEAPAHRRRWAWLVLGAVLLAAALAIGWYYFVHDAGESAVGDEDARLPVISVIVPTKQSVQGAIKAPGTLAARREMPVGVVGEGGRVAAVRVEAGDWVRKGQVLAAIDRSVQSQQARAAAAQIEVARADARLAQANLDRALALVDRGFISRADVDRLTATRDAANARLQVAEAQYRELLARNARLDILAPEGGVVLERNVEPGQTVSAGSQPLFRIARGGELELLARVSENQLARIAVGREAQVTTADGSASFTGQVWQILPTIDPADRMGTVRIALAYSPLLRVGGFATATIADVAITAPILPESAVLSDQEGSYVYIIDKDNKVQRRAVKTGAVTARGIAITEGLSGRERVVLRAGGFLTEGESVKPRLVRGARE